MPAGAVLAASALAPGVHAQDEVGVVDLVRSITVEGNTRVSDELLIEALGVAVGEPFDQEEVDKVGVRRIFETYRVLADVYVRAATGGGVDLRLVIVREHASDLEPRFVGNIEIDREELFEWAGLREREELYLYQAPRVLDRLIRSYRANGFYFINIRVVDRPGSVDPDTGVVTAPDIIFEIEEGPRVQVRDILFEGNTSFLNRRRFLFFKRGLSKLAEIELGSPWMFSWFSDDFVEDTLQADIVAMREVYRSYGFLDAIVDTERLEFSEDRSWVTIHIAVDEGGRYEVGSVSVEGVEMDYSGSRLQERPAPLAFPEEELLGMLKLRAGETYQPRFQLDDERELSRQYGEHGYIGHRTLPARDRWTFLEPELTFEADKPIVHVKYRLAQGRQIFIREIGIIGNTHTQDRVIRRMISVKPGDVADPIEIERSRSRIQGSGYFSDQLDISHFEPSYRFVDTGDPSWKDLEFVVSEGQVLTFGLAGGVSSNDGAFAQISLSVRNFDWRSLPSSLGSSIGDITSRRAFHGAGQELQLSAAPGSRVSTYSAVFLEPDLFDSHEDRVSMRLLFQKRFRGHRSHLEERDEIGVRLRYNLSFDSSVYAGYTLGSVFVDEIENSREPQLGQPFHVPAALKLQEGNTDLAHFDLGYTFSERDSRISTRNGVRFSFDNEIYLEGLGSDAEFIKSKLRFDWWKELDDDPDIVSPYYHLLLGAGVAVPFGDSDTVPYTERFFLGGLGGEYPLRGYRFRGVGPNENGYPTGGQTVLNGSLEYRIPLIKQIQPGTFREYESIQAGIFVDVGVTNEDDFAFNADDIRATVGFLFGITVPIPITFSFGWPIVDPGDSDDLERVFGFNIGL